MKDEEIRRKERRISGLIGVIVMILAAGVILLTHGLVSYTNEQLYKESVAQLNEITEQTYEKLEMVLDYQWSYVVTLERRLMESSLNDDASLGQFLEEVRRELSPLDDSFEFVALDTDGYYYDKDGLQGV